MANPLPAFEGKVVKPGDSTYPQHAYQYATSSNVPGSMAPAAIIYPIGDADITKAVNYARENGLAIAVRSGGHQYSGASSTHGKNIQLDLSQTYGKEEDLQIDTKSK